MYKTILKYTVLACAVLMLGQIKIDRKVLGDHFVSGLKAAGVWSLDKLSESPWVAKILNPKGLGNWFPVGERGQSRNSVKENRAGIGSNEMLEVEEDTDEEADLSEEEFEALRETQPDDTAVMAIIP